MKLITRKLPWLALVEVDLCNGSATEATVEDFLEEVVGDEFLVGGVEAEAGGEVVGVGVVDGGGVVAREWRNVHVGGGKTEETGERSEKEGEPRRESSKPRWKIHGREGMGDKKGRKRGVSLSTVERESDVDVYAWGREWGSDLSMRACVRKCAGIPMSVKKIKWKGTFKFYLFIYFVSSTLLWLVLEVFGFTVLKNYPLS